MPSNQIADIFVILFPIEFFINKINNFIGIKDTDFWKLGYDFVVWFVYININNNSASFISMLFV